MMRPLLIGPAPLLPLCLLLAAIAAGAALLS
jgi:hypothetical protein